MRLCREQIATDIVFQSGAKDGSLTHYANLTMTPSPLFIESYWNWSYSLINAANEILIYANKNNNWSYPTDKALYQAEGPLLPRLWLSLAPVSLRRCSLGRDHPTAFCAQLHPHSPRRAAVAYGR